MHRHAQRLDQRPFFQTDMGWEFETEVLRNGIVLGQSTIMGRCCSKLHVFAKVVSTDSTIVAHSAGNAWLQSNMITWFQKSNSRTTLLHNTCGFMAENKWLSDFELANLSMAPVVDLSCSLQGQRKC